jgi:hypothetical protein
MTRAEKDALYEKLTPQYLAACRNGDNAKAKRIAYRIMELDSSPTIGE